jgi:hypothetical protein
VVRRPACIDGNGRPQSLSIAVTSPRTGFAYVSEAPTWAAAWADPVTPD